MDFKTSDFGAVESDGRIVTGFASIFGNIDLGYDVVHPGAFTKTLKEQAGQIKHLWNHGLSGWWDYFSTPPIAKILELREVGRAELPDSVLKKAPDATGGLLVKREYLETDRGNEVLATISAGVGIEMSFGYDAVKQDRELLNAGTPQEMNVRHLRELRLYDTTDCNFGMNPATVADGGKSLARIGDQIEEIFSALKKGGSMPESFHIEAARIKALFDELDRKAEGSRAEQMRSLTDMQADLIALEALL